MSRGRGASDEPHTHQHGDEPHTHQHGDEPHTHQHGDEPHTHQHGDEPHTHQHGDEPHTHGGRGHEHAGHHHGHEHGGRGHAGHDHSHAHDGGAPVVESRETLAPAAGSGKLLFLDAFSGIAGDMFIAALVDLGVPADVVHDAVSALGIDGVELVFETRFVGAIGAKHFEVRAHGSHPERRYGEITGLIERAALGPAIEGSALAIFDVLARAEARVHRIAVEDVHFHEVGAVDAIVDVVGAAACLAYLGAEVVCTPLPMGRGFVECRHGTLPLPAPATVECLAGVPTYDAGIEAELVTPTGAAIVRAMASRFAQWPSVIPERIGWGRGTRDLPDRPNALRAVLGTAEQRAPGAGVTDSHVVIEATVDDMTGEFAGHAVGQVLASGAVDVWLSPVTMKKGRPGMILTALAPAAARSAVAEAVLRSTTSIGVRFHAVGRIERPRQLRDVQTSYGVVPVKISGGDFGPARVKPEFDVCAKLAAAAGVPVQVVVEAALAAVRDP